MDALSKITKNWFFARNQSWWLIGFSIVMSSGILAESQLICDRLLNGDLSEMWLFWSAGLGSSFGIVFFAHLWKNVPVKTENEFIFFRFSGKGAHYLHRFRSFYLGFIVIPLIMSFHILSLSKMISLLFTVSIPTAIMVIGLCLLLFSFINSFVNRLRFDFLYFIFFLVLFTITLIGIVNSLGGISKILFVVKTTTTQFSIVPSLDSPMFSQFLLFIFIQWWSALIIDYPDQNGQKLMASKSMTDTTKILLLPGLFQLIIRWILFMLPFVVVGFGFANVGADGEVAFINLFQRTLPSWMIIVVLFLFFLPVLSILQNDQNWGGGILIENFFKGILSDSFFVKNHGVLSVAAMVYLIIAACFIAFFTESLRDIMKYMLSITAGVGPVFMLRWYWWRVNAWTQLSAMLAALIYPLLFDVLYINFNPFTLMINSLTDLLGLDLYSLQLIIFTFLVVFTWLSVTFLTSPTDEERLKVFAEKIRPGGFWGIYQNRATCFPIYRFLAWLILAINSFLMYVIFWKFVTGYYLFSAILLLIYLLLFFGAYRILLRVNAKQELSFELN